MNPMKRPPNTILLALSPSFEKCETKHVNRGIVPIKVDATTLSTYNSPQLIRLNGIKLPTIAIKNSFLIESLLKIVSFDVNFKKIDSIIDATNNLKKVNICGSIEITDSFMKRKELPHIADKNKSPA